MNNKVLKTALFTLFSLSFTMPAWSLTADQRIAALEQTVAALQSALNAVKANSVLKLNGKLDVNPRLVFRRECASPRHLIGSAPK